MASGRSRDPTRPSPKRCPQGRSEIAEKAARPRSRVGARPSCRRARRDSSTRLEPRAARRLRRVDPARARARRKPALHAATRSPPRAIHIADAEGFDALSMRRLAAELDAGTMTLYHYVRTKDELLSLVNDAVMGELLVPPGELPDDWRAAITLIAHARATRCAATRGSLDIPTTRAGTERRAPLRPVDAGGRVARRRARRDASTSIDRGRRVRVRLLPAPAQQPPRRVRRR